MNKMTPMKTTGRPGVQLSPDQLMAQAAERTGLSDFGDPWFMEPFKALIGFVNHEGGLKSADVWPVRRVVDMLADRLEMVDYIKRNPDVLKENVDVAGIIVCHARGGSTLTQRLMGRSPQLRATYFWELHTPVPLRDEKRGDFGRRIEIGNKEVRAWADALPEHSTMHPHDARFHEEDLVLGDRGFLSYMWATQFDIPSYTGWLQAQDETRSYEEFKLWLKILQYQNPAMKDRRWLLKSVHHFVGCNLRTMFKTYRGVTAILTHRRMDQVIPSLCSVQTMHRKQSGCDYDVKVAGPRMIQEYLPAFEDLAQVRKEFPANRFVDVHYRETNTKPIDTFRKIMTGMGMTTTDQDIHEATTWMAKNGRDTHPPHKYAAEDFGVTKDQLAETFKAYHDTYDIT
jgi:hypothetical protein